MAVVDPDPTPASASERLLEDSWEARSLPASQRELFVEGLAGLLFLAAATALVAIFGVDGVQWEVTALLIAVYIAVARVEFPIGAGHVVPTQLVLVPMLVVLPPAAVPLAVAASLFIMTVYEWASRGTDARRILSSIPDAWHAIGPAIVIALLGPATTSFDALPLFALAFVACCVTDLVSSMVRMRFSGLVTDLRAQFGVILVVWAVDACLAPIGLLSAIAVHSNLGAVLCVLPLAGLLWMLALDRSRRIEQAYSRLKLVERERSRLQSAVRRLGDAFAARLEMDGLLNILLHGSMEALDADAGLLRLTGLGRTIRMGAGPDELVFEIDAWSVPRYGLDGPTQAERGGRWTLTLPLKIAAGSKVVGTVQIAREARTFEPDEIELLVLLTSKAEHAAGEILANQELRQQAVTDPLTGLGNRRKLDRDLTQLLKRAAEDRPALLLMFDLDGFKAYNDTFGHLAGDALLSRFGEKLRRAVSAEGEAYRLGGDEFCAVIDLRRVENVDRVIFAASEALSERGDQFAIQASLGVVVVPHESDTADHALQIADQRMYADKRGRAGGQPDHTRDVLLRTMGLKQPHLDEHSHLVADLALRVARNLGLTAEEVDEVRRAAELHDVGKVAIPDAVLNKPGPLDANEWAFIRQHTIFGERILNAAPALRPVARLVRSSHERWDSSGYPDGLAGQAIPLGARIVSVCDAYEAMTGDRPYRTPISHDLACDELRSAAGTQFDPTVVDAFIAVITEERQTGPRSGDTSTTSIVQSAQDAAAHVRTLLAESPV